MEDVKTRLMTEVIPGGLITIDDRDVDKFNFQGYEFSDASPSGSYWYDVIYFGYFDLSGYTLNDETVFPQQVILQRVGTYGLDKLQTLVNPTETVIVSTTPLSLNDMTISGKEWAPPNPGSMKPIPPGSLISGHSTQQVIFGEQRGFTLDVGAQLGRIDQNVTWGTGDSTAAEKLYFARGFRFPRNQNDALIPANATYGFQAPDLVISIPIIAAKEGEVEYMMRLQRSVVLAKDQTAHYGE